MIFDEKIVQYSITSPGCNILKPAQCTPTHQGLCNSTKNEKRDAMV
jgi:hypothetical protein